MRITFPEYDGRQIPPLDTDDPNSSTIFDHLKNAGIPVTSVSTDSQKGIAYTTSAQDCKAHIVREDR